LKSTSKSDQTVALLVVAVAEDLFIAVQTLTARAAPEVVAEIALAESEAHPVAVRCLMNAMRDRLGWAEALLTAYTRDARPIRTDIFCTFELVVCDTASVMPTCPHVALPR
jgi:hypothetical protein